MLKPPRVGPDQLRLFVDELGFGRSCQVINVHQTTMHRWLRGSQQPPQAALQALYWLTNYGFSDACAEAHWSHQWLAYKVRELEERLAALRGQRRPIAGCANCGSCACETARSPCVAGSGCDDVPLRPPSVVVDQAAQARLM